MARGMQGVQYFEIDAERDRPWRKGAGNGMCADCQKGSCDRNELGPNSQVHDVRQSACWASKSAATDPCIAQHDLEISHRVLQFKQRSTQLI